MSGETVNDPLKDTSGPALYIFGESSGMDAETIYRHADRGILEDVNRLQSLSLVSRAAVPSLVMESTNAEGAW